MADVKEYFIRVDTNIIDGTESKEIEQQPASTEKSAKKAAGKSRDKNLGAVAVVQIAKQALNFGLSNYGNLTGDYVTQTQIKAGITIAATVATIAINPILGTAAAIGAIGTQALTTIIEVNKKERETALLRQRTQTFTTSGGR